LPNPTGHHHHQGSAPNLADVVHFGRGREVAICVKVIVIIRRPPNTLRIVDNPIANRGLLCSAQEILQRECKIVAPALTIPPGLGSWVLISTPHA
jgi:hypothetical protein